MRASSTCRQAIRRCSVRRERRTHPAGESPARQLSLRPEAIGASREATNSTKPSMKVATRRLSEHAGRNVSERRAGLEKGRCGSRPHRTWGKAAATGEHERWLQWSAGVVATACMQGDVTQHGKPDTAEGSDLQPDAREGQAGPGRVAERLVVPLKPGNAGGGKEPQFKDHAARRRVGRLA